MKITALSDIHGDLIYNIPECDVVCICGDIVPVYIQRNDAKCLNWFIEEFIPWTNKLKCDKVIIIAGNHDFVFNNKTEDEINKIFNNTKIVYLFDTTYTYKGINFYGTPWCQSLKNWAFYAEDDEIVDLFNKIPENTDVLLTHMPPNEFEKGVVNELCFNYGRNFGSNQLKRAIYNKLDCSKTRYILSGHIHSGNHDDSIYNDKLHFVNVSIKDEQYNINYYPFVFNL